MDTVTIVTIVYTMDKDYLKAVELSISHRRCLQHATLLRSIDVLHQHVMSLKKMCPVNMSQYTKARDLYSEAFNKTLYDKYCVERTKLRQYLTGDDMYMHIISEICSTAFDKYRFTIRIKQDSVTQRVCLCNSDILTYGYLSNVDVSKLYDILCSGKCVVSIGFEQCTDLEDLTPLVEVLCL